MESGNENPGLVLTIPLGAAFEADMEEEFDTGLTKTQFDHGYVLAKDGYSWQKVPTGCEPVS